jgi:hypothetical protein
MKKPIVKDVFLRGYIFNYNLISSFHVTMGTGELIKMAVVIVVTRPDRPEMKIEFSVSRKLILGNSLYCDVVLEDKLIAGMQCEIFPAKTGHVMARNLDSKKEVLINMSRLKKAPLKADDVIKIGPFVLRIDPTQLTSEELIIINSEYEEFV